MIVYHSKNIEEIGARIEWTHFTAGEVEEVHARPEIPSYPHCFHIGSRLPSYMAYRDGVYGSEEGEQ